MHKSLLSALVLGTALATAPSAAAQDNRTVSERVSYADLDLATAQGVATLDRRLSGAIRRVCGTGPLMSVSEHFQRRGCRRDVRAAVRPQRSLAIAAAQRGDDPVRIAVAGR